MVPTVTIATTGCNAYRISVVVASAEWKKLKLRIWNETQWNNLRPTYKI